MYVHSHFGYQLFLHVLIKSNVSKLNKRGLSLLKHPVAKRITGILSASKHCGGKTRVSETTCNSSADSPVVVPCQGYEELSTVAAHKDIVSCACPRESESRDFEGLRRLVKQCVSPRVRLEWMRLKECLE